MSNKCCNSKNSCKPVKKPAPKKDNSSCKDLKKNSCNTCKPDKACKPKNEGGCN
jgi:hypothetical protein